MRLIAGLRNPTYYYFPSDLQVNMSKARPRSYSRRLQYCVACILISVTFSACDDQETASHILTNANIYTFAWDEPDGNGNPAANAPISNGVWQPDADAIAISGDKVLFVGTDKEALRFSGPSTQIIDLEGATVLPGVIESHGHVHELGEHHEQLDLTTFDTPEAIVDYVVSSAANVPEGEWIIGWGWDEGAWADNLPDWDLLNQQLPNRPVVLKGRRGFGAWANRTAFTEAGITDQTVNPAGGEFVRRNGQLTGIALNNAVDAFYSLIPSPSLDQRKRILAYGLDQLARSGFVSAHHAGVKSDYLPAYEALADENELPIRVEIMLAAVEDNSDLIDAWINRGPTDDPSALLQVRGVKAYYDGSLGSRGARMLDDYSDLPGHRGVSGTEYGFDEALVEETMLAGFQVGIHAIGDEGNRHVLDFYERVFTSHPQTKENKHRIEHAQIVALEDIPRFGELGVVASMEPGHAVEDSPWAEERVGPERVKGAYAWRSLRKAGATLLFNADYSGTDYSFFYGLYASTTRQQRDGSPVGGWYPEQRVTMEEAIRAYTTWPASASGIEEFAGSIEPGKWADLTIIDIDPMQVSIADAASLLEGEVVMTFVRGVAVFTQ